MRRAVLFVVAACGSDPATPDARPDVVTARCDASAPFQTPVPVGGLNSTSDDTAARFSSDELEVVFARRTGAGTGLYDLYTATRTARDQAFGTPMLLATVNSVNSEAWPTISPDGLLLVFESDRGSTPQNWHIYSSKRATVADAFGPPAAAPALVDLEQTPFLATGRSLYFISAVRSGGPGMYDVWRTEIDSTGATATPTLVMGGVNSPDAEVTPALTPDELRIFFRRTVGAEQDVYTASRASTTDAFGEATPVPGLATPGLNEIPTWISPDGCNLYVQLVAAPGGMGGDDLYVARRGSP
jgi:Tol biopolymer transport system component